MAENWTPIEIQFKIKLNLDSSIFTLNNSFGTKLENKWDTKRKIENDFFFFFFGDTR